MQQAELHWKIWQTWMPALHHINPPLQHLTAYQLTGSWSQPMLRSDHTSFKAGGRSLFCFCVNKMLLPPRGVGPHFSLSGRSLTFQWKFFFWLACLLTPFCTSQQIIYCMKIPKIPLRKHPKNFTRWEYFKATEVSPVKGKYFRPGKICCFKIAKTGRYNPGCT